jgi:hypothetical protein
MNVNPLLWYGERELQHIPPHFTKAHTTLTDESLFWVITKCHGRYTTTNVDEDVSDIMSIFILTRNIYFEDPAEAMMYELRWSGGK